MFFGRASREAVRLPCLRGARSADGFIVLPLNACADTRESICCDGYDMHVMETGMVYVSFVCIMCIGVYAVYYFEVKRNAYHAAITLIMNDFDYFLTSIYIEQENNKYMVMNGVPADIHDRQRMISELSAKSCIECTCVSVHMMMGKRKYRIRDRRYTIEIIRSDSSLVKTMYEHYRKTMPHAFQRKFFMYDGIDRRQCISFDRFCALIDGLMHDDA